MVNGATGEDTHREQVALDGLWLYYFAGPEVEWSNENDWRREFRLKLGVEALFWGGGDR